MSKWSSVSGIEFVEAAPGKGDIRFGLFDFGLDPIVTNLVDGFAYFPDRSISTLSASEEFIGGDVFINKNAPFSSYLMMHEIGHAIGLDHPFDGANTLPNHLDNTNNTVIAYGPDVYALGQFDIQAAQHVYRNESDPDFPRLSWSFDSLGDIITQTWDEQSSTISRSSLPDIIHGGAGNDSISGFGEDDGRLDYFFGGKGDDRFYGTISDIADYSDDEVGAVVADIVQRTVTASDGSVDALNGIANIRGSGFDDQIIGAWRAYTNCPVTWLAGILKPSVFWFTVAKEICHGCTITASRRLHC